MQSLPTSVFKDPVVGAKSLEEAMLAFAEHVRDNGFDNDSPYAAASELLRARPPRRTGVAEALRRADEDAVQALVRLCSELDGGVLPVQGPPGAGKTTKVPRPSWRSPRQARGLASQPSATKSSTTCWLPCARPTMPRTPQHLYLVHKDDEHDGVDGVEFAKSSGEALDRIAPGTIVGGTAWLWAHPDAIARLDVLVIDEAGQMALAQALAAARAARNLVLLGDPQQLEQPTRGAHENGADVAALVHLLGPAQATLRVEQGLFLDRTYRLHPAVCAFTSEAYYEGRLQSNCGLERQRIEGATPSSVLGSSWWKWPTRATKPNPSKRWPLSRLLRVRCRSRHHIDRRRRKNPPVGAEGRPCRRSLQLPSERAKACAHRCTCGPRRHRRQVSGPGSASGDLFVRQFITRRRAARHGVPV